MLSYEISREEVQILGEFFKSRYGRSSIRRPELADIINKQEARKYESSGAKAALVSLRQFLNLKGKDLASLLSLSSTSMPGEVTIRAFKMSIN